MKKILFLLACTSSVVWAQEGTVLRSEPIILKPATAVSTPLKIQILAPVSPDGSKLITLKDTTTVRGTVAGGSNLRRIDVNGAASPARPKGDFAVRVTLHPGSNVIVVNAEDTRGNIARQNVEIIYDAKPPTIEILEPKIEETRGIRPMVAQGSTLRGKAYDESGVKWVRVNGSSVPVSSDSSFWKVLTAEDEQDTLVITAMDNGGRISQRNLLVRLPGKVLAPEFLTGKSYALVIGIDSYTGKWNPLKNAVRDAKAVAQLLTSRFIFEKIYTLYDNEATRDKILETLEYLIRNLRPEDNLFMYYSGHGLKEEPFNRGFWVPVDAADRTLAGMIANSEIQILLDAKSPRHVLLVADACFAGDILRGNTQMLAYENNTDYYRKVSLRKSRKALTSGGEEPVLDGGKEGHSVFAYYFLKAMENIAGGYFDGGQVFNELRIPVANNSDQVPEFAPIKNTGDEGGQFIFVRR